MNPKRKNKGQAGIAKKPIIIGIDNGQKGAIAIITPCGEVEVWPMPVISVGTKKVYDELSIDNIVNMYDAHVLTDMQPHAFIEKAQAMPKQGGVSMFNFGVGYGLIRGMLVAGRVPYTIVRPQEWQKEMLQGESKDDTKAASILVAKRMFPGISLKRTDRCRKDCDGMSDALLIAEYGRRTLSGKNS